MDGGRIDWSEADNSIVMAGGRPIGVKIAGWRHGCCHNVMACEGAPSTTSANAGMQVVDGGYTAAMPGALL